MKNIIISVNTNKSDSEKAVREIINWAEERNITVLGLNESCRKYVDIIKHDDLKVFDPDETIVASLGGDGTMLKTARTIVPYNLKMFGINLGSLGFLTQTRDSEIEQGLNRIFEGNYSLDKRDLLYSQIDDKLVIAVNEFTVYSAIKQRMVSIRIQIDDMDISNISADGVILSTSTGSTAYSMAAGGPIMMPDVHSFIITPICSHNLVQRPIVIDNRRNVRFIALNGDCDISSDSQSNYKLEQGKGISIKKYEKSLNLIQFEKTSFIDVMKEKFFLGKDPRLC